MHAVFPVQGIRYCSLPRTMRQGRRGKLLETDSSLHKKNSASSTWKESRQVCRSSRHALFPSADSLADDYLLDLPLILKEREREARWATLFGYIRGTRNIACFARTESNLQQSASSFRIGEVIAKFVDVTAAAARLLSEVPPARMSRQTLPCQTLPYQTLPRPLSMRALMVDILHSDLRTHRKWNAIPLCTNASNHWQTLVQGSTRIRMIKMRSIFMKGTYLFLEKQIQSSKGIPDLGDRAIIDLEAYSRFNPRDLWLFSRMLVHDRIAHRAWHDLTNFRFC